MSKGAILRIGGLGFVSLVMLLCTGCQVIDLAKKEEVKLEEVRGTALDHAVENAKSSVDYFAVSVRKRDGEKFLARIQHPKHEGFGKSVWVKNVQRKPGDKWSGIFGGNAKNPFGVKPGTIVKFERSQIVDWLIVREGIEFGGFTKGLEPTQDPVVRAKLASKATSSRNPFEK